MQNANNNLSPEQLELYKSILDEYNRYRGVSEEEKEDVILKISSTTFIDLLCDWAFKHVFGHNKELLIMLLNDFLPEKVIDIEYDPNETDIFRGEDKQVIMDVICHTENRSFIVEMQKSSNSNFRNRMLYYGAATITRQLSSGDDYSKMVPVYVICFMDFRLNHLTDQLVYRYQIREQDSGEPYGNQLSIYFCELPRLASQKKEKLSPIEEWFEILLNMSKFAEKPANVNKRFDPVFDACKQARLQKQELEQYFRAMISEQEKQGIAAFYRDEGYQDGIEKGREEGREEGIGEGMKMGKLAVAKAMLANGIARDVIVSCTGLTEEQLKAL